MLIDQIKGSGVNLVAIICDNNRVSQAFNHVFRLGYQRTMYLLIWFTS